MFIETNEIELLLVNIDGFISIDGTRTCHGVYGAGVNLKTSTLAISETLKKGLIHLDDQYELRIISSLEPAKLQKILKQSFKDRFSAKSFAATNQIEQILLNGQVVRALESSQKKPCNSVFICGEVETITQAQSLRLGTIFWDCASMTEDDRIRLLQKGPDFIVNDHMEVQDILQKKYLGYLGEAMATPDDFFAGRAEKAYVNTITFPNRELSQFPLQVSGRYFKANDPRNRKHALSLRILDSKNHMDRQKGVLARIIGEMIRHLVGDNFDFITRIPPKPSQQVDRIREQIEVLLKLKFDGKSIPPAKIQPGLVECVRSYTPQKDVGSYEARRENVRGVFSVKGIVEGKVVVIVDDITTSGSTLMEVTRILHKEGAEKVIPMALSYHPDNVNPSPEALACPKCGGELTVRHRGMDGRPFYGCRNYSSTDCRGGLNFSQGVRELNRLITVDTFVPFEDIDF